ncbi:hypothetical protein [Shewanella sedimentimangrovi]|uniref:Uncharacterized protein n=1 Tax=Shewanella sedimentimangrovi TaxID=2814293 RepID=A0ABX7QZP0_9GAMM|nr:hypothetical protein [Shewanella sedimentimangrovi]QSX37008.1 hypothetical protein JYB85_17385 [Shewanella sedimentimangrovi]
MKHLFAALLLFLASRVVAGQPSDTPDIAPTCSARNAAKILPQLQALLGRADGVWPGYELAAKQLVYRQDGEPWLWRSGQLVGVDNDVLDGVGDAGKGVGFGDYQGWPVLVLEGMEDCAAAEAQAESLLIQTLQEAFIFYVQSGWSVLEWQSSLSGEIYPLNAEVRAVRQHLLQALLQALAEPGARPQKLAEAAFWRLRWRALAPQEDQLGFATELTQGTAAYVAIKARALELASHSGKSWQEEVVAMLKRQPAAMDAQAQSRLIGALAGLLLDISWGAGSWQDAAIQGSLPLELLLGPVSAGRISPKSTTKPAADYVYYTPTNGALTSLEAELQDADLPLLIVPSVVEQSHFEDRHGVRAGPYIMVLGETPSQAYLGLNGELEGLALKDVDALELVGEQDCDGLETALLIPLTQAHTFNDGQLSLNGERLKGVIRAELHQSAGRRLYCAEL